MKKIIKKICNVGLQTISIALVVILIVCPLSCQISTEGLEFITGDYVAPKLLDYSVIDSNHLELQFSEEVNVTGLVVNNNCTLPVSAVQKGSRVGLVTVELGETAAIGGEYVMGGVVEDKVGNSLTFSIPFIGYNSNIPKVIITEFLNESSQPNVKNLCKNEYVELLCLEDGNLFGLAIGSGSWKNNDAFYFPSIEVSKGEEIIVHFNVKGEGCVSELGENLNLATELTAKDGVRDLWLDNTKSVFGNTNDVVYVRNLQNNSIIDGIPYYDGKKTEWSEKLIFLVKEIVDAGIFNSDLIEDSVNIIPITPSNPLARANKQYFIEKLLANEEITTPIQSNKDDWKQKKDIVK